MSENEIDPVKAEELALKRKELRLSFWTNTILLGVLGGVMAIVVYLSDLNHKREQLLLESEKLRISYGDLEFRLVEKPLQQIVEDPCSSDAERADRYLQVILSAGIVGDDAAGRYEQISRELKVTCTAMAKPNPPSVPDPNQCQAFRHITELGWSSGHKTRFCQARGYDGIWNFPGSSYSSGGFCYTGEHEACVAAIQRGSL